VGRGTGYKGEEVRQPNDPQMKPVVAMTTASRPANKSFDDSTDALPNEWSRATRI